MRVWLPGSLGLLAVLSAGTAGSEPNAAAPAPSTPQPASERFDYANGPMGMVCWTAILEAMSDIGRRCEAEENAAFRSALDQSLARLEQHLRERGGWSETQLDHFRVQMSESDQLAGQVCANGDARRMYGSMSEAGAAEIVRATDELISRPGLPEWGDCL